MSTATTACVSGCGQRGEHTDNCPDPAECWGCLPRPAEYGTLCMPCHGRLTRNLYSAPDLVTHLRTLLEPALIQQGDGMPHGESELPIPVNAGAIDAADEIHAQLASWVMLVLEEHPAGLAGPSVAGSRLTVPTTRSYVNSDGTRETKYLAPVVVGLKPTAADDATRQFAQWLLNQQTWIEDQEWAAEMLRDLGTTIATNRARYPADERSRRIPDLPCRNCQRMSLSYHPPTVAGADFLVQCEHHACSAIIPENLWGLAIRQLLDEHPDRKPARRQIQHLGNQSAGWGGAA